MTQQAITDREAYILEKSAVISYGEGKATSSKRLPAATRRCSIQTAVYLRTCPTTCTNRREGDFCYNSTGGLKVSRMHIIFPKICGEPVCPTPSRDPCSLMNGSGFYSNGARTLGERIYPFCFALRRSDHKLFRFKLTTRPAVYRPPTRFHQPEEGVVMRVQPKLFLQDRKNQNVAA